MKKVYLPVIFLSLTFNVCSQQEDSVQVSDPVIHLKENAIIRTSASGDNNAIPSLDHTYLGKKSLLRYQGNTFINTLEKLPGVSAIHTGVGISKPVIRGMSFNRVIVNENGIKQEGQQWGVDHGLEIDQFNVDRVEILKGPVSVLYGSDGIGGVINILPPAIPQKNTFGGDVLMNYKSNNDLWGGSIKLNNNTNDFFTVARATYQNYASYKVPAEQFIYNGFELPIYNNRLKNTAGRELNFSLLNGIRRKWGQSSLYLSNYFQHAGFFTGAFGIPRAYQLTDDGKYREINLPRQEINHFKILSNTQLNLRNGNAEIDAGYQQNLRRELSQPHAHGNGLAPSGNKALQLYLHTYTLNGRYTFQKNKLKNILGVSAQLQQNIRGGFEFLIPDYTAFQTGLFNYSAYHLNSKLSLSAGLRLDAARQKASEGFVYLYDSVGNIWGTSQRSTPLNRQYTNASGSAGLVYELNKLWQLKSNIGTAYRIPVIAELLSNGVHHGTFRHEMGNPNLSAERGYMFDLGLYFNKGIISADITPFFNYFSNYIYLSPSGRFSTLPEAGQIYQYTETEAVFTGIESKWHISITKTLSYHTAIEYVWNKNRISGLGLPFTPPFSALQELEYKPFFQYKFLSDFFAGISGHYFAAQKRTDRNEPQTNGYFLVNFSIGNTCDLNNQKLSFLLQVRNLTNAQYLNNMSRYRILNLPEQGINVQGIVRLEF